MVVEGVATDYENKTSLAANDQGQSVTTQRGILRTLSSSWRRHVCWLLSGIRNMQSLQLAKQAHLTGSAVTAADI